MLQQDRMEKDSVKLALNEVRHGGCVIVNSNDDYTASLGKIQEEIESKFTYKRVKSEILGESYATLEDVKRAEKVLDCGTFLGFEALKGTEQKGRLVSANFCKDRLCPMCNWRRSRKIFGQLSRVMNVLQTEGYKFVFLTLTVRNCLPDDLPETLNAVFAGWRYLYNKNNEFRTSIAGVFRSLEVTRNTSAPKGHKDYGTYHPHLHCVLAVRPSYFGRDYISQKRWRELWKKACKLNYDPRVDVRKCYVKGDSGEKLATGDYTLQAGLEGCKYAVKDEDYLDGNDISETAENVRVLSVSLKRKRLCAYLGVFDEVRKKLGLEDAENGDLVHDDDSIRPDLEYLTVYYNWTCGVYTRSIGQIVAPNTVERSSSS